MHIGAGSPSSRPQPAGKALPGNYDARGHLEPTEQEATQAEHAQRAENARDAAPAPGELSSEEPRTLPR